MIVRDAYTAIADPTRREILDLLHGQGVLTAGEIAAHFRQVSRPAISRHLRVLRECGVVRSNRRGKQRDYAIDKGPLEDIRDGWLAGFAKMKMDSLSALRARVEGEGHGDG